MTDILGYTARPDIDGIRIKRKLLNNFDITEIWAGDLTHFVNRTPCDSMLPKSCLRSDNDVELGGQMALEIGEIITPFARISEYLVVTDEVDIVSKIYAETKILYSTIMHRLYHEDNEISLQNVASQIRLFFLTLFKLK